MRFRFSLVFTALIIAFLWLPFASLCATALTSAFSHPAQLLEALPLRPLQRSLFFNSLMLSALCGAFSLLFGVPAGLALARGPGRARPLVSLLTALPLALPPTLMATAWLEITRTPPARSLASLAAEKPLPIAPVFIAAPILALCYFPIASLALAAALRALPLEIEEAARLFGSPRRALWRVYLPLLWPALAGAAGLCGALALWEMGAPDLLDARTYSVEIYRAHSAGGEANLAALRGLPMLALGAFLLWPTLGALRFYDKAGQGSARSETSGTIAGCAGLILTCALFLASPLAPVGVFVSQLRGGEWRVFPEVWRDNASELGNTIALSTLSAPLLTIIALGLVAAWKFWPPRWRLAALGLCALPILFPPITLGIALVEFFNRDVFALIYGGLPPSGLAWLDWLTENSARYSMMILGYGARFLPLAIVLLHEAARRVDDHLLEAAQNLGASPGRAARTILTPLLRPALLGVAMLLWALCAAELTVSVLVNQPGGQTLPVPIFNLMHIGMASQVAALSLTLFALTACAVAGLKFALNWKSK